MKHTDFKVGQKFILTWHWNPKCNSVGRQRKVISSKKNEIEVAIIEIIPRNVFAKQMEEAIGIWPLNKKEVAQYESGNEFIERFGDSSWFNPENTIRTSQGFDLQVSEEGGYKTLARYTAIESGIEGQFTVLKEDKEMGRANVIAHVEDLTKAGQVDVLKGEIASRIEDDNDDLVCSTCGKMSRISRQPAKQNALEFYEEGWRYAHCP